jgi:hypothetical protein
MHEGNELPLHSPFSLQLVDLCPNCEGSEDQKHYEIEVQVQASLFVVTGATVP